MDEYQRTGLDFRALYESLGFSRKDTAFYLKLFDPELVERKTAGTMPILEEEWAALDRLAKARDLKVDAVLDASRGQQEIELLYRTGHRWKDHYHNKVAELIAWVLAAEGVTVRLKPTGK